MEKESIKAMIEIDSLHPWYQSRLKFLDLVLGKDKNRNLRLVDYGCGSGNTLLTVRELGFDNILGIDVSEDCVKATRGHGISCELASSGFPQIAEGTVDIFLLLDVLEHLENDDAYLEFFYRALKINGQILITVPAHQFLWSSHDQDNHHFRRYSKSELEKKLKSAGFQIELLRWWNSTLFPVFIVQRFFARFLPQNSNSEFSIPPRYLKPLLNFILSFEVRSVFFRKVIGLSLVSVVKKI